MTTIADLKKQYPQYANVPDLKLADAMYKKYYSDTDEDEFYKLVFPNISESKDTALEQTLSPEVDGIISPDDEMLNFDRRQNMSYKPTVEDIAIENDIGTEGAPSSLNYKKDARFAASFGFDDKNKALAVKNVLSNVYNQDIDVRFGNNTGELEFLNPKTNKYELVNRPGVDLGDFTGLGGDAMVILPDIAATAFATVYSGGNLPVGVTAGAVTAGIAEYARYKLGQKLYNINNDVSNEDLLNRAFLATGVSAGSAVLGVGAVKLIKGVNNLIKGRFVKGNDLADARVEKDIIKADDVAKQINDTLDTAKINSELKFSLAKASNDPDLLAAQAAFENQNKLGYMNDFKTMNVQNATALNKYFGFLKSGFNTNGRGLSEFETGQLIKEVAEKRNQPIIKELIQKQANAEEVLESAMIKLPDGSLKETGVTIKSAIDDVADAYKTRVDSASKALDEAAGVDVIESNIIKDSLEKLSTKEKDNLLKVNKISKIFKNEKLYKSILDGSAKIPITTVRNTLSKLKSDIRKASEGSVTGETPDTGALKFLQKTLEKQLRTDAPPSYIDEFDNFNALVRENKKKLNDDLIPKITLKRNGNLEFGAEDLFELSFKRGLKSEKYADELYNVIKDYPDAMTAYKASINSEYKRQVFKNDKINKVAHEKFLKDYDAPLKKFLSKSEYNQIKQLGGFQKILDDTIELRKNTTKALANTFSGQLEKISAGELVNKIYKPNKIGEILELKKILSKDPEVYKAFQRSVLTDINERVKKIDNNLGMRVIDSRSFNNYLNGTGGERGYRVALREIFDADFIKNLDLLNQALKIEARKAPPRSEGIIGSAFSDLIRARLGQFTLSGRLFTAGRRIYKRAAERIMANALLDPQSLKELIELRKLKPNTTRAVAILSKLGGSIFIDESNPENIKIFSGLSDTFFGDARNQN
jgi:hypothetical protein